MNNINFYDKELITLASKKSGLSEEYIEKNDQKLVSAKYKDNNDDRLFIALEKVIKDLANTSSCVIVGRCADAILEKNKNVVKVFLYSDMPSKIKRATKYYHIDKEKAESIIKKTNKKRAKHYKYYTNRNWYDFDNYDLVLNVDALGVEKTSEFIQNFITMKQKPKK